MVILLDQGRDRKVCRTTCYTLYEVYVKVSKGGSLLSTNHTQESIMQTKTMKSTKVNASQANQLQIRLINREIIRLTTAMHRAEMAVITDNMQYHRGPSVHGCKAELHIATQVKFDLMRQYSGNRHLDI